MRNKGFDGISIATVHRIINQYELSQIGAPCSQHGGPPISSSHSRHMNFVAVSTNGVYQFYLKMRIFLSSLRGTLVPKQSRNFATRVVYIAHAWKCEVSVVASRFIGEAIQGSLGIISGLLRYARNDSKWVTCSHFEVHWVYMLFICCMYTSAAHAYMIDGISIGIGPKGAAGVSSIRLGLAKTWEQKWAIGKSWELNGYWDLGFYAMRRKGREDIVTNNKLLAFSLAPMFRFEKVDPIYSNRWLYLELGVGLAQLNKREIGPRELGTNFQFEDKLGVGLRFGEQLQYDLSYKVVHFSNFYLGHKNHGINLHLFSLNYWFN